MDDDFREQANLEYEDEFERIMLETYTNNEYVDEEIADLVKHTIKKYISREYYSPVRHIVPEHHNYIEVSTDDPVYHYYQQQKIYEIVEPELKLSYLIKIENEQTKDFMPMPFVDLEPTYGLHVLSQEARPILSDNYLRHMPAHINTHFRKNKKRLVGCQVFFYNQERTVITWTEDGYITIFYPGTNKFTSTKPFENGILSLTICKEMQYLAVSSPEQELIVFRIREAISIENRKSFRFLKPVYLYRADTIASNIVSMEFLKSVDDNSFSLVTLDENEDVSHLRITRGFLRNKYTMQKLPIIFTKVFCFKTTEVEGATLIAVSSQGAVSLCLLRPKFELLFVYQQTNRDKLIKDGRCAHIDFNNNYLLILWDKYLEIVKIDVGQYQFDFRTSSHYFMAETSLAVGFLSNTLIYQFSRTGMRVYSIKKFMSGGSSGNGSKQQVKSAEILFADLALEGYPTATDELNNAQPDINILREFNMAVSSTKSNAHHHSLVYIFNNQLESLQFLPYSEYLSKIDSYGNWKLGLHVLKGISYGTIVELDCLDNIQRLKFYCIEYVDRYLSRLFQLIDSSLNQDIQFQELLQLCDFLIRTNNCRYLMDEVLTKCHSRGLPILRALEPFILMKMIKEIGESNVGLLFDLPSQVLKKLMYSLTVYNNEVHLIKGELIKKDMFLEMVYLSTLDEDYYTPFVVLMARIAKGEESAGSHTPYFYLLYYLKKCIKGYRFPLSNQTPNTHRRILKEVIMKMLVPHAYRVLVRESYVLFRYVLPELFSYKTIRHINYLESDKYVLAYFEENALERDIIRNLIVRNIPIPDENDSWLADYQKFILDLYVRSLLIDYPVMNGLVMVLKNNLIDIDLLNRLVGKPEFEKQLSSYGKIDWLLHLLTGTNYDYLRIRLLLIKKQYVEAMRLAIGCSRTKNSIFELLKQVMPQLHKHYYDKMCMVLKENIRFLAELDTKELQEILTIYFSEQQNMFISVLQPYPYLQLSLIEAILGNSIDTTLRIRYLRLLILLKHYDKVESYIFKDLYPLDYSLDICIENNLYRCQAYLYERLGDGCKSINKHFIVVNQYLDEFDRIYRTDDISSRLMEILQPCLNHCIRICNNNSQKGNKEYEVHWFVVVEELEAVKAHRRNYFLQIRALVNNRLYPQLFQQIIRNVQLENIIEYLEKDKLETSTVRDSFILMFKAYLYELQTMNRCREMMLLSVDSTRDDILLAYRRGMVIVGVCSVCHGDEDLLIRYPCGHKIHPYCTKEIKICRICMLYNTTYQIEQVVTKQEIGQFNLLRSYSKVEPLRTVRKSRKEKLLDFDSRLGLLTEDMKEQLTKAL